MKPANSSKGKGIYLLKNLEDLPEHDASYVVSKYICNPLLVSGYKFDIRLYVLVTSFDPLRIYIYNEGLVRFASEPYEAEKDSQYAHLTNYSINKKSETFVHNMDANE